jgi:hypothetical protein
LSLLILLLLRSSIRYSNMKYIRAISKFISKAIVTIVLAIVYAVLILPYSPFMRNQNGWKVRGHKFTASDTDYMG